MRRRASVWSSSDELMNSIGSCVPSWYSSSWQARCHPHRSGTGRSRSRSPPAGRPTGGRTARVLSSVIRFWSTPPPKSCENADRYAVYAQRTPAA